MAKLSIFLVVAAASLAFHTNGLAEDAEYDVCICKHVQIGAQSTFRGGVCQRTEAGNCLMQWGSTSKQKVPVGKGDSQEEAAIKAEELIKRGVKGDFKITPLTTPPPGNFSTLQIAIANLSRIPPDTYDRPGMVESFLLAAGTALVRFDAPVDLLAASALLERRSQVVIHCAGKRWVPLHTLAPAAGQRAHGTSDFFKVPILDRGKRKRIL